MLSLKKFCLGLSATLLVGGSPLWSFGNPKVLGVLNHYNFNALERLDRSEMPRFVVAAVGGKENIKGSDIDLSDALISTLNASGRFTFVERAKLSKVLAEQTLVTSGIIPVDESKKIGQLLGADFVIAGNVNSSSQNDVDRISFMEKVVELSVRLSFVNSTTGEIVVSTDGKGSGKSKIIVDGDGNKVSGSSDLSPLYRKAAIEAVQSSAPKLRSVFPLIGFVVKSSGTSIQTDIGQTYDGVTGKSYIAFIKKGDISRNPVTKQIVSVDFEYLGFGKIDELKNGSSTVKVLEATPGKKITGSDLAILLDDFTL
jgi:hypothetical protein